LPILLASGCSVCVATRGVAHRAFAKELGAQWVGDALDRPPYELDRAITFAPSGDVVLAALGALRKGGVVAINAIHLDRMPEFDYDQLLWGEREIRSVANMTRADAHDFLALAAEINLRPRATAYPLDRVEDALLAVKNDAVNGAAVITFGEAALPARSRGFEGATESGGAGANSHDCAGHDPILHLQSCASSRARAGRLL
jgi:propanol-preferring alcohol dehydrogenase